MAKLKMNTKYQVLDELARFRCLPEIPDRAAHPALNDAEPEIGDAGHDDGAAQPVPAPREFAQRGEQGNLAVVLLCADQDQQDQRADERTPELAVRLGRSGVDVNAQPD